jgi:hypothetical protein
MPSTTVDLPLTTANLEKTTIFGHFLGKYVDAP